ncbi:MAG: lysine biosynthesis protein LysX [Promethearchaeota archaeon]
MQAGIIINNITFEARELLNASKKYFQGLNVKFFKNDNFIFDISHPSSKFNDIDIFIQRSLSYSRALYSSFILENYGFRVISSYDCLNKSGNKLITSQILQNHGIPQPKTAIAFNKKKAIEAIHEIGYPVILKPIIGSWGRLVALLDNDHAAIAVLEDRETLGNFYQKIFYIQEYIHKPPRSVKQFISGSKVSRDIRAFVIGDEVVSAMQRYEILNDWRSNVSLGGRAEAIKITPELEEISLKAAKAVNGEIVGVDLMESDKGLVVVEVNGTPQFQGIMKSTGINIPKRIWEYLLQSFKK